MIFLLRSENHYHYTLRGFALLPVTQQLLTKLAKLNFQNNAGRKLQLCDPFPPGCTWTLHIIYVHYCIFFAILWVWPRHIKAALQQDRAKRNSQSTSASFCSAYKLRRCLTTVIWHCMLYFVLFCTDVVSLWFIAHCKKKRIKYKHKRPSMDQVWWTQ